MSVPVRGHPTKSDPMQKPAQPARAPIAAERRRPESAIPLERIGQLASRAPASAPPPRDSSRQWPLMTALLVLPVLAGAVMLWQVGFHFQASTTFSVTRASDGVAAGPAADDSVPLDAYRMALMDTAWHWTAGHPSGPDRLLDWQVQNDKSAGRLTLSVRAANSGALPGLLDRLTASYQDHLAASREAHEGRTQSRRTALLEKRREVEQAIADLVENVPSPAGQPDDATPIKLLTEGWTTLDDLRRRYGDLRQQLDAAIQERDQIISTPEPQVGIIDPQKQHEAYGSDLDLQQDLRHLDLELAQVRRALLKIRLAATADLDEVLAKAETLTRLPSTREAMAWTGERRLRLERIAELAGEFHTLAMSFSLDWNRAFTALQSMDEPDVEAETLEAYARLAIRVGDFSHAATEALSRVNGRVQILRDMSGSEAQYHALTSSVSRLVNDLHSAQSRFARSAGQLTSRDNFLLDAALESARGLRHRARARMANIDKRLEQESWALMIQIRNERIAILDKQIAELRSSYEKCVEDILTAHDALKTHADRMPDFVDQTVWVQVAQSRRAALTDERARLDQALADLDTVDSVPLSAATVERKETVFDPRPVNLPSVLCYCLLAWSLTFLSVLGVTRLARSRNR